jgi:exodeoxyribonuclease VII large subunit
VLTEVRDFQVEQRKFFSLSAITGRIQDILQPHMGKPFWVKAEISSGRERGGSFYCDLVETNETKQIIAQMPCNIWSRDLAKIRKQFQDQRLDLLLDDGTLVGFQCCLQYSPKYGLSLRVMDADPSFALGELELKKQEILNRLIKEGLLEPNKKLPVPLLPIKIGLITSKTSAAVSDFIKTLRQSGFGFQVYLADSIVQGNQTQQSILDALSTLEKLHLELIVIIRGGGSRTELFALDNEAIARKIASYQYPVWTGIGHETDVSILDHVANRHFKTPTAVAEELVSRFVEMKRHLEEAENRFKSTWSYRLKIEKKFIERTKVGIVQGTRKLIDATKAELKGMVSLVSSRVLDRITSAKTKLTVSKRIISTAPVNHIKNQQRLLTEKLQRLSTSSRNRLDGRTKALLNQTKRFQFERFQLVIARERAGLVTRKESVLRAFITKVMYLQQGLTHFTSRFRMEAIVKRIESEQINLINKLATIKASDPMTSLKRGFSLVYKEDNLLKSVETLSPGELIKTLMHDGEISSTIEAVKRK